jgi:hypothetical protein
LITEHLSEENFILEEPGIFYLDDEESNGCDEWIPTEEEYGDMLIEPIPDVDDIETYNKYLNAEFVIDCGDGPI